MLETIIAAIPAGITAIATAALAFITWRYVKLTNKILETYNTPNITIKIAPYKFAGAITESANIWETGILKVHLYTIVIENTGTGAAKDIKIIKDPFPNLGLSKAIQKIEMHPKERYGLITSKKTIEEKAINGFIEYEISYKSLTGKEKKNPITIPLATINLKPIQEDSMFFISQGILAIAEKYTGRDIYQEIKKVLEDGANIIDNNKE